MPICSAKLPGPKGIPLLGNLLQVKSDTIHNDIQKWGEEFGDVFKFRLGHIQLIGILDYEIIGEILFKYIIAGIWIGLNSIYDWPGNGSTNMLNSPASSLAGLNEDA